MPKGQLLAMGMLSKHPQKSTIFKKVINGRVGVGYSNRERMHIVATWFTPELPKSWIIGQFVRAGLPASIAQYRLSKVAYRYKNRWKHLGERNILYIGQPEVQAFYDRYPETSKRRVIPLWAVAVFNQHVKEGKSLVWIAKNYGLSMTAVCNARARGMFSPRRGTYEGNTFGNKSTKPLFPQKKKRRKKKLKYNMKPPVLGPNGKRRYVRRVDRVYPHKNGSVTISKKG